MASRMLAWSRAACSCALITAAIAGCTSAASSSVTVKGKTLTIYASAPPGAGQSQLSQDVIDSERLALQQNGSHIGKFTIRFDPVHGTPSDNARTAIQNTSAIAYLGEIVPQASSQSLGITNALDLLQVSPTDTALELTQSTAAVPGAPDSYYESLSSYGRTFARVVPSTALEARAQVEEMQALGVKKLYVAGDGEPYGSAIALAVKQDAGAAISVVEGAPSASSVTASGADAMFLGSVSPTAAARTFNAVAAANPQIKLFGPSALASSSFAAALSAAAQRQVYISTPGFLPADLTPAGRTYVSDFTSTYGHPPATEAIFGYEAMSAVLAVLREAGSAANDRATVVRDFFHLKNRQSVLGTYSINTDGDTSLGPFVFSRDKGGTLVPAKFVSVGG